ALRPLPGPRFANQPDRPSAFRTPSGVSLMPIAPRPAAASRPFKRRGFRVLLGCLLAWAATVGPARADEPDFTREVRPVLARYCFKCHGPDKARRKAGLRLDVRESAVESVIVPGRPAKSQLLS